MVWLAAVVSCVGIAAYLVSAYRLDRREVDRRSERSSAGIDQTGKAV